MKLSFIIPAFNEEKYLAKCLESIIAQVQDLKGEAEIIVVNNASTDKTRDVALSFPSVVVVDEPRKGITYARQAGFFCSRGEIIANVDADSILPPGWVKKVLSQFSSKPKLVALSGPFVYYDLPIRSNILVRVYYYFAFLSYLLNRFVFRVGSLLQGGNFVIRRSALEKVGGFNTQIEFYGEDTEIARRLHKVGPVKFTLKLPMYSSGRRLKAGGFIKMGWKYPVNYFWMVFAGKPFHHKHIDIRPDNVLPEFKTTIISLKKYMLGFSLVTIISLFVLSSALYASVLLLVRQQYMTVAQAKQSDHFIIRKLGPSAVKLNQKIRTIDFTSFDTDGD